jgi:hypothetical protein
MEPMTGIEPAYSAWEASAARVSLVLSQSRVADAVVGEFDFPVEVDYLELINGVVLEGHSVEDRGVGAGSVVTRHRACPVLE